MINSTFSSIYRASFLLIFGMVTYVSIILTFSFFDLFTDPNNNLLLIALIFTTLIVSPAIFSADCISGLLALLHREKKLFQYCLIKIAVNTFIIVSTTFIILPIIANTIMLTAFLPVFAVLLGVTLLYLIIGFQQSQQLLSIILIVPLLSPVLIASCLLTQHNIMAAYFLGGWILINIVLLKLICKRGKIKIINLS